MACDKEGEQPQNQPEVIENKSSETILTSEPSIYGKYLKNPDKPMIGYSTMKENSLANNILSPVFSTKEEVLKNGNNSFSISANGHDIGLASDMLKKSTNQDNKDLTQSWYGQDVQFIIRKEGALKSGSNIASDTIQMYIPELVQITSPKIESEEELYPYCYYKNFKLAWNADPENQNGLVVIVEWLGTTVSEDGDFNQFVRNIDVIKEDNGETTLNDKLFDNIPDRALAYVTLLRGNIELPEIDSTI